MAILKDKTGLKYGMLTVMGYVGMANGSSLWECECECGNRTVVRSFNLTSGHTISCGCAKSIVNKVSHSSHGGYGTRLYTVWRSMVQRCCDSNHHSFMYYGKRGIKVCNDWKDFAVFKKWAIENGYDSTADRGVCTLDRIDNNGDYSPYNCRWVTHKEQMRNVRTNRLIEYNGESKTLSEWAESCGLSTSTLYARLKLGWSIDDALNRPLRKAVR